MVWNVPTGLSFCVCPACGEQVLVFGRVRRVLVILDADGVEHVCWRAYLLEPLPVYCEELRASGTMFDILLLSTCNKGRRPVEDEQLGLGFY